VSTVVEIKKRYVSSEAIGKALTEKIGRARKAA
jgi:hypothetical protein